MKEQIYFHIPRCDFLHSQFREEAIAQFGHDQVDGDAILRIDADICKDAADAKWMLGKLFSLLKVPK